MEFKGVVFKVLDPQKGMGAKGEWVKQDIVFEMPQEFNRKIAVTFWGDKVAEVAQMRIGDSATVAVNVESREYNGKWYTDVKAWKVTCDGAGAAAGNVPPFVPSAEESFEVGIGSSDDIPF